MLPLPAMLRNTRLLTVATLLTTLLAAQDDARDKVTKTDGKVVAGRVQNPHATGELVLLQGGKRVRIARDEVAKVELVADRVREFCERRVRMRDSTKAQQFLIDWAVSAELPGLARAQATWLVLRDDTNETAHQFLGHKKGPKGWQWEHEGKWMTREQLDTAIAQKPMTIAGERFSLRFDAGLETNVAALLDLEQLGVAFHTRFGAELQLQESQEPIAIHTWRNGDEFPKWGFRPLPFYVPPPHGDVGRTFYSGPAPQRPQKLFFVGTEALLYRTLIGEVNRGNDRDRVCPWLEIGLGMYFENTMQGDAGFAAPGELRAQDLQALQALGRDYRLTHLLHLPMYSGFYLNDDTPTATNWSAATMFVAWLLEANNDPDTRAPFLRFVREALGEKKGDSSSLFDRSMGQRIEEMDAPWRDWLAKKAGY